MAREVESLEAVTHQLLETIKASSTPAGRRNGSGAHIQTLVREVLQRNANVQTTRAQVEEHQARQAIVRDKIQEVEHAEETIDKLLMDLQVTLSHTCVLTCLRKMLKC